MNIENDIKNAVTDAENQVKSWYSRIIDFFKNSKFSKFFQKWIGLIIAVIFIIMFVIILAMSGVKYSIGKETCVEALSVDKSQVKGAFEKCEKDRRGSFVLQFISDKPEMVPEDFTIYKAIEYRETGKIINQVESVKQEESKPVKKGFFKKVFN